MVVSKNGEIAYAFTSPSDLASFTSSPRERRRKGTDLNEAPRAGKQIARSAFHLHHTTNKFEIKPSHQALASSRTRISPDQHHGGRTAAGQAFNFKIRFTPQGWATLMVNYRGSTATGNISPSRLRRSERQ